MSESSVSAAAVDLELLRSGVRLIALRAIGDPDAADEVAQETLVRAVDVLRCPESVANVGAYVAGIARHVIADHFRAKQRVVPLDQASSEALHAHGPDPLAVLCSEGESDLVRHALNELSADDRELLHLCYFEGLTPTEIAERMGAPPERIRQRKVRALHRLRTAFDGVTQLRHARAAQPTVNERTVQAEGRGSGK